MTMCAVLDNRHCLPPFPPLGRCQEYLFMLVHKMTSVSSHTAHVPHVVAHRLMDNDRRQLSSFRLLMYDIYAAVLQAVGQPTTHEVDGAISTKYLATGIRNFTRLSHSALNEWLHERWREGAAAILYKLETATGHRHWPSLTPAEDRQLRAALRSVFTATRRSVQIADLPYQRQPLLESVRRELEMFSDLLENWQYLRTSTQSAELVQRATTPSTFATRRRASTASRGRSR
jgi:hypothetical protein